MKKVMGLLALISVFSLFTSCDDDHFREEKIFAGGKVVSSHTLNKGKSIYEEYCMACHGAEGNGKGVASKGMKVPPRDFTTGVYKFGRVGEGELPRDEDFFLILEKGLHGTAMLPWDLAPKQMNSVVQYIKTFAPEQWVGKDKEVGEAIVVTKDPFGMAHRSSAIAKGKEVYHIQAQCQSCHRAYATHSELNSMSQKVNQEPYGDFDDDLYQTKRQDTDWDFTNIPPDFTWHLVRSASTVEELYVRITAGVGGTAMPAWRETITDEEIWAVSHYVRSLMDLKDKPERKALINQLRNQ
jgi:mono/diheme cytochrome c family protein